MLDHFILPMENTRCIVCNGELTVVTWNSKTNVAYCGNLHCARYRNPIATQRKPTPVKEVVRTKEPDPNDHKYTRKTKRQKLQEMQ